MPERRWDPFQREWVVTAPNRQDRTFRPPEDACPFCPTTDEEHPTAVPASEYDVAVVENAFPAMQPNPPEPSVESSDHFLVQPATGACEVILFTADHDAVMSAQPVERFEKIVSVWRDRYETLGQDPNHRYVYLFENTGTEIGVSLQHPHGQVYAYPFVPPTVERELASSRDHFVETGQCLYCDVLAAEREAGDRVVTENDHFTAVVPFQARYPYEVHVYANEHLPSLSAFDAEHQSALARLLKDVRRRYDALFGFELPFVMGVHQQPTDGRGSEYAHFHAEFYPPHRTADKLKHLAGSERGAGTFVNNRLPEDAAAELRDR